MSKWIQEMLNKDGFNLVVDGSIGRKTISAIKEFQKRYNLFVDGKVGPQTTEKLKQIERRKFIRKEYDNQTTYFLYPKKDVNKIDVVNSNGYFETVMSMYKRTLPDTISNGGLYNMKTGESVHFHFDEGKRQGYNGYAPFAFCVFNDGTMRFQPVHQVPSNLKDAIGFSPSLVIGGVKNINSVGLEKSFLTVAHPRHAFMETKNYYIEVFVRGRTKIWFGCSIDKLANICIEIGKFDGGCLNAGALDGGGSMSLVTEGTEVIQRYNRAVDNAIAIYMNK